MVIKAATASHSAHFVNNWVFFHLAKAVTDTTWNYRLFPWDRILASFTCFAADLNGTAEGLLAVEMIRGADKLKVRFLSTAPWNFGPNKQRSGVGTSLLRHAVQLSKDCGYAGAELSSTPESETFYERMNWRRTGLRDHEGLAVFELPPDQVDGFLAKHPPLSIK